MGQDKSRRRFLGQALAALALSMTFGFTKHQDVWKSNPKNDLNTFFNELDKLTKIFLKGEISGTEWINYFNRLMSKYWTPNTTNELLQHIDFEKVTRNFDFTEKGRANIDVGTPIVYEQGNQRINTKIIGIAQGHNIPPHAHEHMGSSSIVLSGKVRVRSYDRIHSNKDGLIIKPISNQVQNGGDWSSISHTKSNIHWFNTINSNVFLLNVNVEGIDGLAKPGIRIDPQAPDSNTGLIKADYMDKQEAEEKYG